MCLKLLIKAAKSKSKSDWVRWMMKIAYHWTACTPHEQRLAMSNAATWNYNRRPSEVILREKEFVFSHRDNFLAEERRKRLERAPFPAAMTLGDGGSRI